MAISICVTRARTEAGVSGIAATKVRRLRTQKIFGIPPTKECSVSCDSPRNCIIEFVTSTMETSSLVVGQIVLTFLFHKGKPENRGEYDEKLERTIFVLCSSWHRISSGSTTVAKKPPKNEASARHVQYTVPKPGGSFADDRLRRKFV